VRVLGLAIAWVLCSATTQAAEQMEAVGAEKCGGAAGPFTVEFVAPEDAQVEASAKATRADGTADATRDTATLSLNGQACTGGTCRFRAKKGETYTLVAQSTATTARALCISVAKPT
jgi:hypothetical protein